MEDDIYEAEPRRKDGNWVWSPVHGRWELRPVHDVSAILLFVRFVLFIAPFPEGRATHGDGSTARFSFQSSVTELGPQAMLCR